MSLNSITHFAKVPTPHMPRTKSVVGPNIHSRKSTFKHGHLIPWYARLVYPHSNLKMDMSCMIRMDTSVKVPLDDVFLDNYFFFVPLRIIDPNFEKILGHKDIYDNNTYNFPLLELDNGSQFNHDSLIQYFGYNKFDTLVNPYFTDRSSKSSNKQGWEIDINGTPGVDYPQEFINPYLLAAYYKVWNEYFRDENLNPEIPISDLVAQGVQSYYNMSVNSIWHNFEVLPVNRYHDMFSSGLVTPVKGGNGDVTIPLGLGMAPVVTSSRGTPALTGSHDPLHFVYSSGSGLVASHLLGQGADGYLKTGNDDGSGVGSATLYPDNLWTDLSRATQGIPVQQLYLSLALYSLYDKRGTFGTRLIEQIRGSFGLEVPDGLLDRAEYLGGSNQSLNNVPVLNTADDLGTMRGNSSTITGLNSFDKGFNEWGIVIGLSCTRIKHDYSQGIANPVFKMFDNLDMYWPEFANIGKVGVKKYRIANNPLLSTNNGNFNYNEPWLDERMEIDYSSGDFGSFRLAGSEELREKWSYQDIYSPYSSGPTFSADWLAEPVQNVQRTLSSLLIPYATQNDVDKLIGHQFMIRYNYHIELTEAIPVRSEVPNITGRI